MKKGQLVVKVLSGAGVETATIERIASVTKKGVVRIEDSALEFDLKTGREINPAFSGMFSTRLIPFDGGEEDRWDLK